MEFAFFLTVVSMKVENMTVSKEYFVILTKFHDICYLIYFTIFKLVPLFISSLTVSGTH